MEPYGRDVLAFGQLFEEQRPRLERLAERITHDPELAKDVVANAAIRVWQRAQDAAPEHLVAYLVRAVQNEARDQLRRRANIAARQRHWGEENLRAQERAAATSATSLIEDRDVIDRLLPSLSERQRRTLELRYLEDLSDADIAQRIGVETVTVRAIAHRALHRLRARAAHELAEVAA